MVSSIGAYASDLMQYVNISSNSTNYETTQGISFDELIGNGKVTLNKQENNSTGITAMGGFSNGSDSSETYSEMDLNQDGTVTIDEIMRYTEMQMMEKMQEQMTEEAGDEEKSDNKNAHSEKFDLDAFKTQMATKSYQMGEALLNTSIGAVTQSFAV